MAARSRLLLATFLLAAVPGIAEARYACAVRPTSDGFVALRQGPSTKHPVVGRMKAHELVGIMDEATEDIVREGDWLKGTWYPGTRRTAMHTPDVTGIKGRTGWVRDRLLNCFEE